MSFFHRPSACPEYENLSPFIFRHNKNVQNSKSKCSKTFFANTWCSGLRAGAPVQAAEISFRSWERTPGQPHPPLTHTGKKEEKHFSFGWLKPTQVRGKRTRKTRSPGNACYAYFNFPSPTPHQKKSSLILWFLYLCLHKNTSELESSVSLIFPSAERICKRAKVDFLRRRFLILVTFRSQTAYHSTFQQNTTFCSQTYNTT